MGQREMMRERFVQRLKEQQQRGRGGATGGDLFKKIKDLQFFSCSERKHTIDILPYFAGKCDPRVPEGEEAYVFEFYIHRDVGVGEGSILCPAATFNEPCPICEDRRRKIRAGATEKSVARLRPGGPGGNPRSLYNIICYDTQEEMDKGVQVFHTSHYLMEDQLQELAAGTPVRPGQTQIDPLVLFMDPKEGKSIVFTRVGKQEKTRYMGMQFADRPKGFVIDPRDLADTWALDELIVHPTYEEVWLYYYGKDGGPEEIPAGEYDGDARRGSDAGDVRRGRGRGMETTGADTETTGAVESRRSRRNISEETTEGQTSTQSASNNPCPAGHVFGADVDKFPRDCEPCDQWKPCSRKAKELLTAGAGTAGQESSSQSTEEPSAGRRRRSPESGTGGDEPETQSRVAEAVPEEGRRRRRA